MNGEMIYDNNYQHTSFNHGVLLCNTTYTCEYQFLTKQEKFAISLQVVQVSPIR